MSGSETDLLFFCTVFVVVRLSNGFWIDRKCYMLTISSLP